MYIQQSQIHSENNASDLEKKINKPQIDSQYLDSINQGRVKKNKKIVIINTQGGGGGGQQGSLSLFIFFLFLMS